MKRASLNRRGPTAFVLTVLCFAAMTGGALAQESGGVDTAPEAGQSLPPGPPEAGNPPPAITLHEARVRPRRAYFDGLRPLRFVYELAGSGLVDLRFDVVERSTGAILTSLFAEDVEAGVPQSLEWNGRDSGGRAARGALRFDIRGIEGDPLEKSAPEAVATDFALYDHVFPLPARHSFGDGLGAGRNHGGQDIAAGCGKRLLAARGGRVRYAEYQPDGAGYYLVIDGKGTRLDYVYMHLEGPAEVDAGERVKTGQLIGRVGSTGRSTACHLHFELWRGPWFDGGTRIDPAPALRRWDRYS